MNRRIKNAFANASTGTKRACHDVVAMATAAASPAEEIRVDVRGLVEALDTAVYVHERWPYVIDGSGLATQFLKYQRGSFLMARAPTDM